MPKHFVVLKKLGGNYRVRSCGVAEGEHLYVLAYGTGIWLVRFGTFYCKKAVLMF